MDYKYGAEQIALKKPDVPEVAQRINEINVNHNRINLSLMRLQETIARLTGPYPVDSPKEARERNERWYTDVKAFKITWEKQARREWQ